MVSAMLNPEYDFEGRTLQVLSSQEVEWLSFSLIATDSGGAAVFSWVDGTRQVGRMLADSLDRIADDELPDALLRFAFEMAENTFCGSRLVGCPRRDDAAAPLASDAQRWRLGS
jgi:hypothetical protein